MPAKVHSQTNENLQLAVVVGNSQYSAPYAYPQADGNSSAMAQLLTQAGYNTILLKNATKSEIINTIREARNEFADASGNIVFYYSGQAATYQTRSFLFGADTKFTSEAELKGVALDLNVLISEIDAFSGWNKILIFNSCAESRWNSELRVNTSQLSAANIFLPQNTFMSVQHTQCYIDTSEVSIYSRLLFAQLQQYQPIEKAFARARRFYMEQEAYGAIPYEITNLQNEISLISEKSAYSATEGIYTDPRTNLTLKWVKVGEQIVMAKNMDYELSFQILKQLSGNIVKQIVMADTMVFYNWNAAMHICPEGWHLPGSEEWKQLTENLGGQEKSAQWLKGDTYGQKYQQNPFQAQAFGYYSDYGQLSEHGISSYYWASDPTGEMQANVIWFGNENEQVEVVEMITSNALNVRCFKNN